MRKFFKRFLREVRGSEFVQTAIIIAVVAALAVVVFALFNAAGDKIQEATNLIEGISIPPMGPGA